jgi:hypothetical protein
VATFVFCPAHPSYARRHPNLTSFYLHPFHLKRAASSIEETALVVVDMNEQPECCLWILLYLLDYQTKQ